jgi:hypothetical protein
VHHHGDQHGRYHSADHLGPGELAIVIVVERIVVIRHTATVAIPDANPNAISAGLARQHCARRAQWATARGMKRVVFVAGLLMSSVAHAEIDPAAVQLWDVVYAADGSVLKGVIVEEVPNTSVRIVLVGGSSIIVQMPNVTRFAKELNPAFQRGAVAVATVSATPAAAASSGLRIAVLPMVATHSDVDETTFMAVARVGYEIGLEKWGLTPGGALLYAADTGIYANDSVGIHGTIKAAYRGGSTVSPFVGFGLGVDFVGGEEASLATLMTAGLELVVHRRVALLLEGRLQKGFGGVYTPIHEFAAFGIGIELRL